MTDPSSTCRRWKFDSNIFALLEKLFRPGHERELRSQGVLNGDCKSHWLTNEEIKDGEKIRETVDSSILSLDIFPYRYIARVCLYRKNVLFLTTLLIKTTPSKSAG